MFPAPGSTDRCGDSCEIERRFREVRVTPSSRNSMGGALTGGGVLCPARRAAAARVGVALMEGWEGRRGSAAFKERRAEDFGVGAG